MSARVSHQGSELGSVLQASQHSQNGHAPLEFPDTVSVAASSVADAPAEPAAFGDGNAPVVVHEAELEADSDDEFDYADVESEDFSATPRAGFVADDPSELLSALLGDAQRRRVQSAVAKAKVPFDQDPDAVGPPSDRDFLRRLLELLELRSTMTALEEEWAEQDEEEAGEQQRATSAGATSAAGQNGAQSQVDETQMTQTTAAGGTAATREGYAVQLLRRWLPSGAAGGLDGGGALNRTVEGKSVSYEKYSGVKQQLSRMTKERDFHRMHHKRISQEKSRLQGELSRAVAERDAVARKLNVLERTNEANRRDKALASMKADRLQNELEQTRKFGATAPAASNNQRYESPPDAKPPTPAESAKSASTQGSKMRSKRDALDTQGTARSLPKSAKNTPGGGSYFDSTLPAPKQNPTQPFLDFSVVQDPEAGPHMLRTTGVIEAHDDGVTAIVQHPSKSNIAVTTSDDNTWKMWAFGDEVTCILSGEGHADWVSDAAFYNDGSGLASASGDGTVKLWDFETQSCVATIKDHKKCVWSCEMHWGGDFLLTASMDHCAKLLDLNAAPNKRCRTNLRGHADSVNYATIQPFTNHAATASGDKTVCMWDLRSGHAIQTFTGHRANVEHVCFSPGGDMLASTDSEGDVRLWDVRMVSQRASFSTNIQGANRSSFHPSGRYLVVPTDESPIFIYDTTKSERDAMVGQLTGAAEGTSSVAFVSENKMRSAGQDGLMLTWSM